MINVDQLVNVKLKYKFRSLGTYFSVLSILHVAIQRD